MDKYGLPNNHKERMADMEGCEFGSALFEDIVMISEGKVYSGGYIYLYENQIDPRVSKVLYDEYIYFEIHYMNYSANCEQDWWDGFNEKIWKKVRKNLWKQGHYGKVKMNEAV